MKICDPTLMVNLRYRLVAETGGYTIEQLEHVSIRLLKYPLIARMIPLRFQQAGISHTPFMQALATLGRAEVLEVVALGLPSWVEMDLNSIRY